MHRGKAQNMQANAAPPQRGGWTMVVLLCLLATLSYLDRYIVSLLADPITKGLGINATDIGLLIGLGFGLLYSLSCVPLGHLLDYSHRVRIVGAGVLIWSASTVASAFAGSFGLLLMTRSGVAIGEAVLVPATVSLVADVFPPDRRTLPIGLFMAVSSLMSAGAFLIGGFAFQIAQHWGPHLSVEPWRLTLILVGVPGLILAPIWLLLIREPRRNRSEASADGGPSIAALLEHLKRHGAFYLPFLTSFGFSAVATYGFISWASTMLMRSYGLTLPEAGSCYGTAGLVASGAATAFWPFLFGQAIRRGRADLGLPFLAAGLGFANLLVGGLVIAHSLGLAIAIIAGASFGYAAAGGLAVLIIQRIAPASLRAKLTSLYMLLGNLIGLVFGPPATAWISEHVYSGQHAMRMSLATIAAVFGAAAVPLVLAACPAYRRLLRDQPGPGGQP